MKNLHKKFRNIYSILFILLLVIDILTYIVSGTGSILNTLTNKTLYTLVIMLVINSFIILFYYILSQIICMNSMVNNIYSYILPLIILPAIYVMIYYHIKGLNIHDGKQIINQNVDYISIKLVTLGLLNSLLKWHQICDSRPDLGDK